jgi:hypothetical protein
MTLGFELFPFFTYDINVSLSNEIISSWGFIQAVTSSTNKKIMLL